MSRLRAYVIGLGVSVLVALPAFARAGWDSFPLSSYPMFARKREKPLLYYVEASDPRGTRERLAPRFVANDEVMQAASTIRRAVTRGEPAMRRLCSEVARRVAASAEHARFTQIEIVGAQFDPIRYFVVSREPERERVYLRCDVERL